jgi:hypothetical protein
MINRQRTLVTAFLLLFLIAFLQATLFSSSSTVKGPSDDHRDAPPNAPPPAKPDTGTEVNPAATAALPDAIKTPKIPTAVANPDAVGDQDGAKPPDLPLATNVLPGDLSPVVDTKPHASADITKVPVNLNIKTPAHIQAYFDQVYSVEKPTTYPFDTIKKQCAHTKWQEGDLYLHCTGMAAGLTSIMSQVKVCFKYALEAGTHLILPVMPLRDSTKLDNFNVLNDSAQLPYEKWFDADHLITELTAACPQMKVVKQEVVNTTLPVKYWWDLNIEANWDYRVAQGYFWSGRPFRNFFDSRLNPARWDAWHDPKKDTLPNQDGIQIMNAKAHFLIYKIMDDPSGHDLRLWNDLDHLFRFLPPIGAITEKILEKLGGRPFYGVHFRAENDTIWSSADNQLKLDLEALEQAWKLEDKTVMGDVKPLVYLACGDPQVVQMFVDAGKEQGWEVTHKWDLLKDEPETLAQIAQLPFDFQGALDLGIMVMSQFFIGITGSAFSMTVANIRDPTGRYRGSTFDVVETDGAKSHLFNDLPGPFYPCCL